MATEIFKKFSFDAAHNLGQNVREGHKYGNLHGHSFHVGVFITGAPQPDTGWVVDFEELNQQLSDIHATLDHSYLNDIEGLESPTLENICLWIWERLKPQFEGLSKVTVERPSCFEGCSYTG